MQKWRRRNWGGSPNKLTMEKELLNKRNEYMRESIEHIFILEPVGAYQKALVFEIVFGLKY